jgi:Aldehyde dehydrogenase family
VLGASCSVEPTARHRTRKRRAASHHPHDSAEVTGLRAADTEDTIRLANDTEYRLAATVFGRDVARAVSVAQRIHSGICHINEPTVQDEAQVAFGGTKVSGYGRFGGRSVSVSLRPFPVVGLGLIVWRRISVL